MIDFLIQAAIIAAETIFMMAVILGCIIVIAWGSKHRVSEQNRNQR